MTTLLRSAAIAILVIASVIPTAVLPAIAGPLEIVLQFQSFPLCDNERVLRRIVKRFNSAEDDTWNRGIYLDAIERTRERTVLDNEERLVPRRYCRGHALLTNGRHPTVFYLIEGGQGFAGLSYSVEFCVNGLDPWREFDGSCRVLRY